MTAAAAAASSPDVGSSAMSSAGFLASATASERRRRCPPDRPAGPISSGTSVPACSSAHEARPTRFSSASVAAILASRLSEA